MDRIRLLWSPGSLTLWPIPSGGGASLGRNALPRARALCGAFLAGQTAEEAQGSGRSQGQVVTRQGPGNHAAFQPQPALEQDKRHYTEKVLSFLLFGTEPSPAALSSLYQDTLFSRSGRDRRRKEVRRPIVLALVPEIPNSDVRRLAHCRGPTSWRRFGTTPPPPHHSFIFAFCLLSAPSCRKS